MASNGSRTLTTSRTRTSCPVTTPSSRLAASSGKSFPKTTPTSWATHASWNVLCGKASRDRCGRKSGWNLPEHTRCNRRNPRFTRRCCGTSTIRRFVSQRVWIVQENWVIYRFFLFFSGSNKNRPAANIPGQHPLWAVPARAVQRAHNVCTSQHGGRLLPGIELHCR